MINRDRCGSAVILVRTSVSSLLCLTCFIAFGERLCASVVVSPEVTCDQLEQAVEWLKLELSGSSLKSDRPSGCGAESRDDPSSNKVPKTREQCHSLTDGSANAESASTSGSGSFGSGVGGMPALWTCLAFSCSGEPWVRINGTDGKFLLDAPAGSLFRPPRLLSLFTSNLIRR